MQIITSEQFKAITTHTENKYIKFAPGKKPKVIETAESKIIKIFYPKKRSIFSKNKLPALKFCHHAQRLIHLKVGAPKIESLDYCRELQIHLVSYEKLKGEDVRSLVRSGKYHMIHNLAIFIASLHTKGIYFRAIHLANLLHQEQNQFALIDIDDIQFRRKPLSLYMRYRNLKHLFIYRSDKAFWLQHGIETFMDYYFQCSNMNFLSKNILMRLLNRLISQNAV